MEPMALQDGDEQLRIVVRTQIEADPWIMSRDIAVEVEDGVITLTGFVHNFHEKLAAEKAAKAVYGVRAVANDIQVRALDSRTDPEIARDLVHEMATDQALPEWGITATVKDGFVMLEGAVQWPFQRAEAVACANRIPGVRGVVNNIIVEQRA